MIVSLKDLLSDEYLEKAAVTKNAFTQLTGLSHNYLNVMRRDGITMPGRDKIIVIGLGLNLSLEHISAILRHYKHMDLEPEDTKYFIDAAKARKISGIQSLYRGLSLDLLLLAAESLSGGAIVVNDEPSLLFLPYGYLQRLNKDRGITNPFYHQLHEAIYHERKRLLAAQLEKNHLHYMMCGECFERYLERAKKTEARKKDVRVQLTEMLAAIQHPNHRFDILDCCPQLRFYIHLPADQDNEKEKAFFGSRDNHDIHDNRRPSDFYKENRLSGFATDVSTIVEHLKAEYEDLKTHINSDLSKPENMQAYIEEKIKALE
jgi:hypothetical protein